MFLLHNSKGATNHGRKSVLIVGAAGRTGVQCIRHFSQHPSKPTIHAFCLDATKLSKEESFLCTTIIEGDARKSTELQRALRETQATTVVVTIGNGDSLAKTDLRTVSAFALSRVLEQPEFEHCRTLVVSSSGAGEEQIVLGYGIGKLLSFRLRHILRDHNGQEKAFRYNSLLKKRTTIVRPTALQDNKASGTVITFAERKKCPSTEIDRSDLAAWIVNEVCSENCCDGKVVNLTGLR